MKRILVALGVMAGTLACGGAQGTTTTSPSGNGAGVQRAGPARVVAPRSAIELVTTLQAIVAGRRAGSVDDYLDRAFAERLPSGGELADLFRSLPEGCVPTLSEGAGYGAVAIPPPMNDDTPEEVARIEAIIEELQASTEVEARCEVVEMYQDEADEPVTPHERTMMLFAIAVRRDASGAWRVMAWRDFRDEDPMAH